MTTSMYGTPLGFRTYDEDAQNLALKGAQTQLVTAQAASAQAKALADAQQAASLAAARAKLAEQSTKATDLADTFDQQARVFSEFGLYKSAGEAAKTGSKLKVDAATIDGKAASQALAEAKKRHEILTSMEQTYYGVRSQADLDRANMVWQSRHPDEPLPKEMQFFDPGYFSAFNANTKTAKEKSELRIKEAEAASKIAYRNGAEAMRAARRADMDRRFQLARDVAERRAKQGGSKQPDAGDLPAPNSAQTAQATLLLRKTFDMPADDAKRAGADIAAEARAKMYYNRGLLFPQALQQAYDEAIQRGDIEASAPMFGVGRKDGKYAPEGKSPTMPAAVPADKDASKLVAGRFYRDSTGAVARWNGKKFDLVELPNKPVPKRGTRPMANILDNEDEDEEDIEDDEE